MRTVTNCAPIGAARSFTGQASSAPKWMQLRAIEEARESLGLKATSISVMRAMLSFMSADRVSEMADDHHIVYASNATIAGRAHVSIQTVERHISKLIKLGIIQRVTAANGKRWCRRDGAGQVTLVSGLSLLPLATRHAEFSALAGEYRRAQETLQMLRDECTLALTRLHDTISDGVQDLLVRARLILRRRPQQDVLQGLLDEINECISVENGPSEACEAINLRAGDGKIEGHKEHSQSHNCKKEDHSKIKVTQDQMEHAFPRLCSELRFARDQAHCDRLMDQLADHMLLGEAWYAMKSSHGPATRFMALGYILQRVERIQSHRAYLTSIMSKIDRGDMEPTTLLIPQKTRPGGLENLKNA
ncbi:helix-turn-helix domain-containing protein [uncultured Ruegeria sp.]|uniref:helix-turn-helix domain-containing protein n=1 Tax=uncultured Ruegeria sp. TaxID=259304 RepID=UPI002627C877|nr:helix-turn-helix domain-containing protein [uncultured Ruegeria sp.]